MNREFALHFSTELCEAKNPEELLLIFKSNGLNIQPSEAESFFAKLHAEPEPPEDIDADAVTIVLKDLDFSR